MRRRSARTATGLVVMSLLGAAPLGCGEDTPMGGDLASPAERDATPDPTDDPAESTPPPVAAPGAPRIGAPAAIGDAPDAAREADSKPRPEGSD